MQLGGRGAVDVPPGRQRARDRGAAVRRGRGRRLRSRSPASSAASRSLQGKGFASTPGTSRARPSRPSTTRCWPRSSATRRRARLPLASWPTPWPARGSTALSPTETSWSGCSGPRRSCGVRSTPLSWMPAAGRGRRASASLNHGSIGRGRGDRPGRAAQESNAPSSKASPSAGGTCQPAATGRVRPTGASSSGNAAATATGRWLRVVRSSREPRNHDRDAGARRRAATYDVRSPETRSTSTARPVTAGWPGTPLRRPDDAVASGSLLAPMPGTVVSVAVEKGDEVTAGQPVLVLEAMKMQHTVAAPLAASSHSRRTTRTTGGGRRRAGGRRGEE